MKTEKERNGKLRGRRTLRLSVLALAAAAVAALLAACGGGGSSSSSTSGGSGSSGGSASEGVAVPAKLEGNAKACGTLNLYTWEGEAPEELLKPFEAKYGVQVKPTYMTSSAEAIAKLAAGATSQYDLVIAAAEVIEPMVQAEVIKPINPELLTEYKNLLPFTTESMEYNGNTWAMVSDWGKNPFIYNTELLKKPPTSWAELWSPKLKGQVALWEDISLIWIGASVLGMDKEPEQLWNLSQEQLNEIRDKMLELKGNVRTMWSSAGDLIQLYANKEVGASMGWSYVLNELKAKGEPVAEANVKDMGAQAWTEGPAMTTGISPDCEAAAYDFMNYLTSPKGQAALSKSSGYTPVNPAAKQYMSKEEIERTGLSDPKAFLGSAIVKKAPKNPEAYNQTMQEIIAGLNG
ncbi:MAG: extracellular solute-binding protein [Actinobacteria bacterium]|nr:extracellular solute-binding protein [Actinomycetota bacterium]